VTKYSVTVEVAYQYQVEVEAPNQYQAMDTAKRQATKENGWADTVVARKVSRISNKGESHEA